MSTQADVPVELAVEALQNKQYANATALQRQASYLMRVGLGRPLYGMPRPHLEGQYDLAEAENAQGVVYRRNPKIEQIINFRRKRYTPSGLRR